MSRKSFKFLQWVEELFPSVERAWNFDKGYDVKKWKWAYLSVIYALSLFSLYNLTSFESRDRLPGIAAMLVVMALVYFGVMKPKKIWSLVNAVRGVSVTRDGTDRGTILFITSNGAGLGHLTRVAAVASALRNTDYHVLTMSRGHYRSPVPRENTTYFPSYGYLGMQALEWEMLLEQLLSALIGAYKPAQIVFDGTFIYRPVTSIARKKSIPLVWLQRGCWKPLADESSIQRHNARMFADRVIIPGDYGCDEKIDLGPGMDPEYVDPITLTSSSELLSREAALSELGLDMKNGYVLVQLGAGTINDVSNIREWVENSLPSELVPVTTRNPLNPVENSHGWVEIDQYPVSRYFNAFEFSIQAGGYNSVQESIELSLPTIFVPNTATKTDDQSKRCLGVAAKGLGLTAVDSAELTHAINLMSDSQVRAEFRRRLDATPKANGAKQAAELIENKSAK